jgi:microcystin-dependent protein
MSEPFLSEIKIVSFNFAPKGWALCNGQFLPINQNQALFALLGTTYGGNGQTTFALPNLRGRVPIHIGNGHTLGEAAGSTSVTINIQQMPQHVHFGGATSALADTSIPTGNLLAGVNPDPFNDHERRWQPATQQHDAVSGAELYYRAPRHLPIAELRRRRKWHHM